jgi:hypothetical protein
MMGAKLYNDTVCDRNTRTIRKHEPKHANLDVWNMI